MVFHASDAEGPRPRAVRAVGICFCLHAIFLATVSSSSLLAEEFPAKKSVRTPAVRHRSRHLELHTDLSEQDAKVLSRKLESVLRVLGKYWRRPVVGTVVCYVVEDLSNWPRSSFPYPEAHILLKHVKGGTRLVTFPAETARREVHVYAMADPGIVQHELVHAYCLLTFGTCGPDWYKEGMAEFASRAEGNHLEVICPVEVVHFLNEDEGPSIPRIVRSGEFTEPLTDKFDNMGSQKSRASFNQNRWSSTDDEMVRKARESYHRSWSLCHFLFHNRNYQHRFHLLGMAYLNNVETNFDRMFRPVKRQLEFEYRHFREHFDQGYRVDLCRWDWEKEFATLTSGEVKAVHVSAARGYQPSGLMVNAKETYRYRSTGKWATASDRDETTADGELAGRGRLVGAILQDYVLSEPFDLGSAGEITIDRSGQLYLRCQDTWHELGDNRGRVTVRWQRK